jgi:outer membrane protein
MNSKNYTLIALLAGLSTLAVTPAAHAQKAGGNSISIGLFNIRTNSTSDAMTTTMLPMPIHGPLSLPGSFSSPGTSLSTSNANTLGLTLSHFFTDNIAVMAIAGIPPKFKLYGHGQLKPPGPAGAMGSQSLGDRSINPIVTETTQWSLASVAQYHFFSPTTTLRPFVGLGASYNFFTGIKVNPEFAKSVTGNLGAILAAAAGKPGATTVEADASSSWAPVLNVGATYNLTENWALTASATYIPMSTDSTMKIKAADGTVLAISKTTIKPKPMIFFAAATYKF